MVNSIIRSKYVEGWRQYPKSAFGHHVQGAFAGLLTCVVKTPEALVVAGILALSYIAYQGLSVIKKKDAAGLDVMDFLVGFGLVAYPCGLWWAWSSI